MRHTSTRARSFRWTRTLARRHLLDPLPLLLLPRLRPLLAPRGARPVALTQQPLRRGVAWAAADFADGGALARSIRVCFYGVFSVDSIVTVCQSCQSESIVLCRAASVQLSCVCSARVRLWH